jgi:hypothetical protein
VAPLAKMISGTKSRKADMAAEGTAQAKRAELGELDMSEEERKAAARARQMATGRDGRASTRLSDSILGGAAPLG